MEQSKIFAPHESVGWVEASLANGHATAERTVEIILEGDDSEESGLHPDAGLHCRVLKESILLRNSLGSNGCEDMVNLNHLHEPAILYNLRQRFLRHDPYTYTGPICIAVNPYDWLDMYNEECQQSYYDRDRSELPPHVYAISASSYQNMRMFGQDQSILVSGESGAGKTETTKLLMSHLASAGPPRLDMSDGRANVVDRVLRANPLLESFGNAQTVRNDNSSRFGKYSELHFNEQGQLIGAESKTYLLEKSRVSNHGIGERSYHIFYQVLCAPDSMKAKLFGQNCKANDFPYIRLAEASAYGEAEDSKSSSNHRCHMNDTERLQETLACLKALGVSNKEQLEVFQVVAAILYLSCLQFKARGGDDEVAMLDTSNQKVAHAQSHICHHLCISEQDLNHALTTREISLTAVTERYEVPLTIHQAENVRTALAILLYTKLFEWLIHRVNASTSTDNVSAIKNKICILDIFGFENFKSNSFEQLCINYANEKLQQKFTQDVFKCIQAEYEEEGLTWRQVVYQDNINVLDLIDGRFGILSLLNEECIRPKGSDQAFSNKLVAHYGDHESIAYPRFRSDAFIIKHYAGHVTYSTLGFLLKNIDTLHKEVSSLMERSKSAFMQNIVTLAYKTQSKAELAARMNKATQVSDARIRKARSPLAKNTVAIHFKAQLNALMLDIGRTNVHYIRCIKPNSCKSPRLFNKKIVAEQLRCAGVVEAVRISRCMYPNRMLQTAFIARFRCMIPHPKSKASVGSELCANSLMTPSFLESIVHSDVKSSDPSNDIIRRMTMEMLQTHMLFIDSRKYQVGRTRVFFRHGALEMLEELRAKRIHTAALSIQCFMRGWLEQSSFSKCKRNVVRLQTWYRSAICRRHYQKKRFAAIRLQTRMRCTLAKAELNCRQRNTCALRIQALIRMYLCRSSFLHKIAVLVRIQCIARMFLAIRAYRTMKEKAREEAKVECQIQFLKTRLAEEKKARLALEQQTISTAKRPSIDTKNAEALEDADIVIEQLRRENLTLKKANMTQKACIVQLRQEKEVMERGAFVNGASFVAANQRAMKSEEELHLLKEAHARIKSVHRMLKAQNTDFMEEITELQMSLHRSMEEKDVCLQQLGSMTAANDAIQHKNASLAKANARLRLILRQDEELSQKYREEMPRLTKLAHSSDPPPLSISAWPPLPESVPLQRTQSFASSVASTQASSPGSRTSSLNANASDWTVFSVSGSDISDSQSSQPRSPPMPVKEIKPCQNRSVKTRVVKFPVKSLNSRSFQINSECARESEDQIMKKLAQVSQHMTSDVSCNLLGSSRKLEDFRLRDENMLIRLPTAEDGPIDDCSSVLGLASSRSDDHMCQFQVTLSIDTEAEKCKGQSSSSHTGCAATGNHKRRDGRSSDDPRKKITRTPSHIESRPFRCRRGSCEAYGGSSTMRSYPKKEQSLVYSCTQYNGKFIRRSSVSQM